MNLTISVDKKFVELIDSVINECKTYSSRSEFLKDAVREKIEKLYDINWRLKFREDTKKMAETAKARGWNGELITKEEKNKIATEHLKDIGIDPAVLEP